MLQAKAHGRPMMEKVDDNIYKTSCSLPNFINYFIPFGKEIEILDNDDIKIGLPHFTKGRMRSIHLKVSEASYSNTYSRNVLDRGDSIHSLRNQAFRPNQ